MPSDPDQDRQRLGERLIRRRLDLDPRYKNRQVFADERGVEYRIVSDIERARRANFHVVTIAEIERAYRLAPGAIARFLGGGELEPQGTPAPHPPAPDGGGGDFPDMSPAMKAQAEPHVRAIRSLVEKAIMDNPDSPVPRGDQVFASRHEQDRWDRVVAAGRALRPGSGWPLSLLIKAAAVGRVRDAEKRQQQGGQAAGLAGG